MSHVVVKREFEELIDTWAAVSQVGTGFTFTEGPIWHPVDHYLLFSDMPADVRRRWDQRGGVREVKRPSNKCNGMTYDKDLNLIVCEHATSSLVRERPDGGREVIASHFEGYELNSPNDVVVKSDGSIYFSDPWYGRMPVYGVERPRQLGFQGVYRVPPGGGDPVLEVDRHMFDQPNGLCFSPDEHRLYVNDTVQALIRVFDVSTYGSLLNGRVFASGIVSEREPGLPDGMKCDSRGNVWCTGPGGVWVYAPSGELIGKVRVPEMVANLAWGGPDFQTLYMCATHSVYAVKTKVGPRLEPYMRARNGGATANGRSAGFDAPYVPPVHAPAPTQASSPPAAIRDAHSRSSSVSTRTAARSLSRTCRTTSSWTAAHSHRQARRHTASSRTRLPTRCGSRRPARRRGVMVIHVWFIVEPGAPGVTLNAPLFEGLVESKAMVRGSWGAAPVRRAGGQARRPRRREDAHERLGRLEPRNGAETGRRDIVMVTGAWTNMSIEHTARTGADKGYIMIVPEDCCSTMNADWHRASINYALQNVSAVTKADDVIAALG